ncbi:MAG: hypothetical protein ACLP0J_17920 [Solirubrobacteraceae bacterium]
MSECEHITLDRPVRGWGVRQRTLRALAPLTEAFGLRACATPPRSRTTPCRTPPRGYATDELTVNIIVTRASRAA